MKFSAKIPILYFIKIKVVTACNWSKNILILSFVANKIFRTNNEFVNLIHKSITGHPRWHPSPLSLFNKNSILKEIFCYHRELSVPCLQNIREISHKKFQHWKENGTKRKIFFYFIHIEIRPNDIFFSVANSIRNPSMHHFCHLQHIFNHCLTNH